MGHEFERFDQYYKNIKIEHSDIRIHYLNNSVIAVYGEYINAQNIDISIIISKETAIQKAKNYIGAKQYFSEYEILPNSEIVICNNRFTPEDTLFAVAYKITLYALDPFGSYFIYVDAKNGNILNKISKIYYDGEKNRSIGVADTRYSGTRNIITTYKTRLFGLPPYYTLIDSIKKIETYNLNKNGNPHFYQHQFEDNDNYWSSTEYHNNKKDDAALDAHWGAMMTYDYFLEIHNRNGFSNNGKTLKNGVHWGSSGVYDCDQAGWFSDAYGDYWTILCDGIQCDAYTALDIIAHEIGHGVCQFSANLVYQSESGAINESLSDIWAACITHYATPDKQIWLLGEDIGCIIRSMSNPKSYGQPDTYGGTN